MGVMFTLDAPATKAGCPKAFPPEKRRVSINPKNLAAVTFFELLLTHHLQTLPFEMEGNNACPYLR
jgi:hypothetical protein